ncbi:MAG: hypothetical protein FJ145_19645 [Deltaproteobacteria bacterium]|nr:hypothetical protein [Deltaproteobacteria bacterium]
MARTPRAKMVRKISNQWAEDAMWGIPESPEFSSVERLMHEFQSHAEQEERWLEEYRASAKEASDPLIRFLLALIVADEERHHDLTGRMVTKLREELAWSRSKGLPRRALEPAAKGKQLLVSINRFIEAERQGIKEYKRLKTQSQGMYREVFSLLYGTMIHDSYKHLGMLEFLRDRLAEGRSGARQRKLAVAAETA